MRWIGFGAFNVQPSEIAKVFVVLFLAGYLVRRQEQVRESWAGFIKPFAVLMPMALLLLLEPDFGATVVMFGAAAAMLFLGGVGLFRFGVMVLLAVGAVVWLVQDPYRWARMTNFADPWADQFGAGYQLSQALIAFGRGEWIGVGLGNSIQKQFYLPEAHTDFVFSVLAEELGLRVCKGHERTPEQRCSVLQFFGSIEENAQRLGVKFLWLSSISDVRIVRILGIRCPPF